MPGEFQTPEEIYGLVIGTHKGEPVYLKDVARGVDGFKEENSISRLNGRDAVNLAIKKRAGENIIAISRAVDRIIATGRTAWPQATEVTKVLDKSRDIEMMIADLENNILSGLVLVLLVIFLSMGFRNAILVSLAIPFSMLISFTILYAMGITLNMVVLFSLTLALGMLVDNAIVIIENSYRFMQQGAGRVEAARRATSEVAWPVIGSTVTTLAAFFPMLYWPGIMGEFMRFLPITPIVTLTSSLFVALVINPAMASIRMRIKGEPDTGTMTIDEISAAVDQPARISGPLMALPPVAGPGPRPALIRPWSQCLQPDPDGRDLVRGDRPGKTGGVLPRDRAEGVLRQHRSPGRGRSSFHRPGRTGGRRGEDGTGRAGPCTPRSPGPQGTPAVERRDAGRLERSVQRQGHLYAGDHQCRRRRVLQLQRAPTMSACAFSISRTAANRRMTPSTPSANG